MWEIEFTDEFRAWWETLDEAAQNAIYKSVETLRGSGPSLGRPQVDSVYGSRHSNLKELRTQQGGLPYRTFFIFDPRRCAVLLIGGCKAGDRRFYERMIPLADDLYDMYLKELREEGLI